MLIIETIFFLRVSIACITERQWFCGKYNVTEDSTKALILCPQS